MYAIFDYGGRQYRAENESVMKMDKLEAETGAEVSFDKVLMLNDGQTTTIGSPYIEGVKVTGKVVQQGKDRKIRVFKYKPKKRYKLMRGHRQHFTAVKVTGILGL